MMDPELREALGSMHATLSNVAADSRTAAAGVAEVRADLAKQKYELEMLKSFVHGSNPPPPPPLPGEPRDSQPSLSDYIEDRAGEVAKKIVSDELVELRALRVETRQQSKALGIGVEGFKWLRTREGRTFVAALAGLIFAIASVVGAARAVAVAAPHVENTEKAR